MSSTPSAWISRYLAEHPIYSNATPLDGGVSNYLYRLNNTSDRTTVILKHAEPYSAAYETWAWDLKRMDCEYAALSSIPAALLASSPLSEAIANVVTLPAVLSYDPERHVLIMADCGAESKDMHTAFPGLSPSCRLEYGRRLGVWLAALHTCPSLDKTAFAENMATRNGLDQRVSLLGAVLGSAEEQAALRDIAEPYVVATMGSDAACVVHGDFWPGNFLVQVQPTSSSASDEAGHGLLAVIDWECTRLGSGASDVGQFAAEAWLLCHFHRSSARASFVEGTDVEEFGMMNSFLGSYATAAQARGHSIDEEFLEKALVYFALHLSVGRGTKEQMAPVKRLGIDVVKLAVRRDWDGLLKLSGKLGGFVDWIAQSRN